ncbi:MAG: flagellar basal-body rod protein FlgG [Candidatus Anammoxibacter sp.]
MIKALFTLATGMKAQQTYLNNIANNLANINTVGFKRSQVNFQDLLYSNDTKAGSQAGAGIEIPTGLQIGAGVRLNSTSKIFTQGTAMTTNNPLDIAIMGDGFFQITKADGSNVFTRDGAFRLNGTGQIVTTDGLPMTPTITIPNDATNVTIGTDGTVNVQNPNGDISNLGQLQLVKFVNPGGLESLGRNLYRETIASGAPTTGIPGEQGMGEIFQGFLEGSNVDTVTELVNMITAQRAFEVNSRGIRAADQMLQAASSIVR